MVRVISDLAEDWRWLDKRVDQLSEVIERLMSVPGAQRFNQRSDTLMQDHCLGRPSVTRPLLPRFPTRRCGATTSETFQ
jgi:hypothetical protein